MYLIDDNFVSRILIYGRLEKKNEKKTYYLEADLKQKTLKN